MDNKDTWMVGRLRAMKGLVSSREAAILLGCCQETLYRWRAAGKLSAHRVGSRWKFDPAKLADFLEARGTA